MFIDDFALTKGAGASVDMVLAWFTQNIQNRKGSIWTFNIKFSIIIKQIIISFFVAKELKFNFLKEMNLFITNDDMMLLMILYSKSKMNFSWEITVVGTGIWWL